MIKKATSKIANLLLFLASLSNAMDKRDTSLSIARADDSEIKNSTIEKETPSFLHKTPQSTLKLCLRCLLIHTEPSQEESTTK